MDNYFTIKTLAGFLNEETKMFEIISSCSQEKNKIMFELEKNTGSKTIEFSVEKNFKYLILKNNYSVAKKNVAMLLPDIAGKKILKSGLYNDDRVIEFLLEDDFRLFFTFFSNDANCYVAENNIIKDAFKKKDYYLSKDINEILRRKKTETELNRNLTAGEYIKETYTEFGKIYRAELLYRSGMSVDDVAIDSIRKQIEKNAGGMKTEFQNPEYRLYNLNDDIQLSLTELKHLNHFSEKFENINELLFELIKRKARQEKIDSVRKNKIKGFEDKIKNINKKLKGFEMQIKMSSRSEEFKEYGEKILQFITTISKGDRLFSIANPGGKDYEIKLKPELSPSENAQYYFEKYRRQKGSVEILRNKISNLEKLKERTETELSEFVKNKDYKMLMKEEKKVNTNLNNEKQLFRRFKLNENYEVWVGKDSKSNDLLTVKYTAPYELWFHVRGASGSHTVLKLNGKNNSPGKEIITKAASIAAYYSKARNASSVPVAYCEKKYVKKRKGFKEGSVIMEREKVIFVKPELPENTES